MKVPEGIQLVMKDNTPCPPQGNETAERRGSCSLAAEKKVSLLEIPDFSSNQAVFLCRGQRWGRGEGNVASGCECMCEGVHSSLHKPPASSAVERRLVLTDMLQSQQSLQEKSSSSAGLICSPCPWCSLGDCQGSQPSSQSSFDWVG